VFNRQTQNLKLAEKIIKIQKFGKSISGTPDAKSGVSGYFYYLSSLGIENFKV
jgi:hypothetical protein